MGPYEEGEGSALARALPLSSLLVELFDFRPWHQDDADNCPGELLEQMVRAANKELAERKKALKQK